MHYHVCWSSTGFDSTCFPSYPEAFDAAQAAVQRGRPKLAGDRSIPVRPNETFSVEMFDEICPVCLKGAAEYAKSG